jgi:hypothetical protein
VIQTHEHLSVLSWFLDSRSTHELNTFSQRSADQAYAAIETGSTNRNEGLVGG